jgi:hypothetical protein
MSPTGPETQQRIAAEQQRLQRGADRTPEAQRASETYIKRVNILLERIKAVRTRMDSDTKMAPVRRQKIEALCSQIEQNILSKLTALQPALVVGEVGKMNASIDGFLATLDRSSAVAEWRTGDRVVFDRAVGGISRGGHQLFVAGDGKYYVQDGKEWKQVDPTLLPVKPPPAPLPPKVEAEVQAFHETGAPLSSDTIQRSKRVITPKNKEWKWGLIPGNVVVFETPVGTVELMGQAESMSEQDAHIIVNALLQQQRIAIALNAPADMVQTAFKVEWGSGSDTMMNNWGTMFVSTVRRHVEVLRSQGASDAEIVTELSGHIFHEAVHDTSADGTKQMYRGNPSNGEISTITTQTAYYISAGYHGPTSYEPDAVPAGAEKIRKGQGALDRTDYDVATCVAGELIHRRLAKAFPKIAREIQTKNPLEAAHEIAKRVPVEDQPKLLTALREAVADSCDPKELQDLQTRLKAPPPPPPPRIRAAQSANVSNIAATEQKLDISGSDPRSESDIDEQSKAQVNIRGRR